MDIEAWRAHLSLGLGWGVLPRLCPVPPKEGEWAGGPTHHYSERLLTINLRQVILIHAMEGVDYTESRMRTCSWVLKKKPSWSTLSCLAYHEHLF